MHPLSRLRQHPSDDVCAILVVGEHLRVAHARLQRRKVKVSVWCEELGRTCDELLAAEGAKDLEDGPEGPRGEEAEAGGDNARRCDRAKRTSAR